VGNRRKGRDRRIPLGAGVWLEKLIKLFSIDWAVASELNYVLTGTPPNISELYDLTGAGRNASDDGVPSDLVLNDVNFGNRKCVSSRSEFLAADAVSTDLLSGAFDGELVIVGAATGTGHLFSSSALNVYCTGTSLIAADGGAAYTNTVALLADGAASVLSFAVTGSTGIAIYRNGTLQSGTPAGTMPATLPAGGACDIGRAIGGTAVHPDFRWPFIAWRATKFSSAERAALVAKLQAYFGDLFWGTSVGVTLRGTSAKAITSGWGASHVATKKTLTGNFTFRVKPATVSMAYMGVAPVLTGPNYWDEVYGWRMDSSPAVRELGVTKYIDTGGTKFSDIFTVERSGTSLLYKRNGVLKYTNPSAPIAAMFGVVVPNAIGDGSAETFFESGSSLPDSWENSLIQAYELDALFTADNQHVVLAAGNRVECVYPHCGPGEAIRGTPASIVASGGSEFGGHDVFVFDASNFDYLQITALVALLSGATQLTIGTICKQNTIANPSCLIACGTVGSNGVVLSNATDGVRKWYYGNGGNWIIGTCPLDSVQRAIFRFDGTQALGSRGSIYVNGVNVTISDGMLANMGVGSLAWIGRRREINLYHWHGSVDVIAIKAGLLDPVAFDAELAARYS
jgi:hypothetical protein